MPVAEKEEKPDKPRRKRKATAKQNTVPTVLAEAEEQSMAKEMKSSVPDMKNTALHMENKTAATVENVSAKEIGNSDHTYQFPPLELLKKGKTQTAEKEDLIRHNAIKLQEVLKSFGVNVTMTNYSCGPSVTRYEMVPMIL